MGNNNIINGNCWVAYFDILGFKEKISAFDGHLDAFEQNFYSNLLDKLQRQGKYWPDKVFTAWASDTFLFFTRDDSKSSFGYIAKSAKHFYWDVMPNNWPLRTAIGFGQLYADRFKSIFLGSGLIDAYEYAEKQNWIGIVVTPKANSKLRELGVELQRRPAMFKEYDVPVKRKVIKNGICTIVEETERLFAMRIHEKGGINAKGYIEQMQRDAMNDKDYEVK
jgi:hypothetical protein